MPSELTCMLQHLHETSGGGGDDTSSNMTQVPTMPQLLHRVLGSPLTTSSMLDHALHDEFRDELHDEFLDETPAMSMLQREALATKHPRAVSSMPSILLSPSLRRAPACRTVAAAALHKLREQLVEDQERVAHAPLRRQLAAMRKELDVIAQRNALDGSSPRHRTNVASPERQIAGHVSNRRRKHDCATVLQQLEELDRKRSNALTTWFSRYFHSLGPMSSSTSASRVGFATLPAKPSLQVSSPALASPRVSSLALPSTGSHASVAEQYFVMDGGCQGATDVLAETDPVKIKELLHTKWMKTSDEINRWRSRYDELIETSTKEAAWETMKDEMAKAESTLAYFVSAEAFCPGSCEQQQRRILMEQEAKKKQEVQQRQEAEYKKQPPVFCKKEGFDPHDELPFNDHVSVLFCGKDASEPAFAEKAAQQTLDKAQEKQEEFRKHYPCWPTPTIAEHDKAVESFIDLAKFIDDKSRDNVENVEYTIPQLLGNVNSLSPEDDIKDNLFECQIVQSRVIDLMSPEDPRSLAGCRFDDDKKLTCRPDTLTCLRTMRVLASKLATLPARLLFGQVQQNVEAEMFNNTMTALTKLSLLRFNKHKLSVIGAQIAAIQSTATRAEHAASIVRDATASSEPQSKGAQAGTSAPTTARPASDATNKIAKAASDLAIIEPTNTLMLITILIRTVGLACEVFDDTENAVKSLPQKYNDKETNKLKTAVTEASTKATKYISLVDDIVKELDITLLLTTAHELITNVETGNNAIFDFFQGTTQVTEPYPTMSAGRLLALVADVVREQVLHSFECAIQYRLLSAQEGTTGTTSVVVWTPPNGSFPGLQLKTPQQQLDLFKSLQTVVETTLFKKIETIACTMEGFPAPRTPQNDQYADIKLFLGASCKAVLDVEQYMSAIIAANLLAASPNDGNEQTLWVMNKGKQTSSLLASNDEKKLILSIADGLLKTLVPHKNANTLRLQWQAKEFDQLWTFVSSDHSEFDDDKINETMKGFLQVDINVTDMWNMLKHTYENFMIHPFETDKQMTDERNTKCVGLCNSNSPQNLAECLKRFAEEYNKNPDFNHYIRGCIDDNEITTDADAYAELCNDATTNMNSWPISRRVQYMHHPRTRLAINSDDTAITFDATLVEIIPRVRELCDTWKSSGWYQPVYNYVVPLLETFSQLCTTDNTQHSWPKIGFSSEPTNQPEQEEAIRKPIKNERRGRRQPKRNVSEQNVEVTKLQEAKATLTKKLLDLTQTQLKQARKAKAGDLKMNQLVQRLHALGGKQTPDKDVAPGANTAVNEDETSPLKTFIANCVQAFDTCKAKFPNWTPVHANAKMNALRVAGTFILHKFGLFEYFKAPAVGDEADEDANKAAEEAQNAINNKKESALKKQALSLMIKSKQGDASTPVDDSAATQNKVVDRTVKVEPIDDARDWDGIPNNMHSFDFVRARRTALTKLNVKTDVGNFCVINIKDVPEKAMKFLCNVMQLIASIECEGEINKCFDDPVDFVYLSAMKQIRTVGGLGGLGTTCATISDDRLDSLLEATQSHWVDDKVVTLETSTQWGNTEYDVLPLNRFWAVASNLVETLSDIQDIKRVRVGPTLMHAHLVDRVDTTFGLTPIGDAHRMFATPRFTTWYTLFMNDYWQPNKVVNQLLAPMKGGHQNTGARIRLQTKIPKQALFQLPPLHQHSRDMKEVQEAVRLYASCLANMRPETSVREAVLYLTRPKTLLNFIAAQVSREAYQERLVQLVARVTHACDVLRHATNEYKLPPRFFEAQLAQLVQNKKDKKRNALTLRSKPTAKHT